MDLEARVHRLIHDTCENVLPQITADCIFADIPDNINMKYRGYADKLPRGIYLERVEQWIRLMLRASPIVWISFNAKWTPAFGKICEHILAEVGDISCKPCVQTFTFGLYNCHDFANCHRPLWRFRRGRAPLYPDQVRIKSARQLSGDPRADPRGKIPSDVFDFPRVTGNSNSRRRWCPTQLHEGLVERCIKFSTQSGDHVCDPFAGTGTTLRVCKQIDRRCTTIEICEESCQHIAQDNNLTPEREGIWTCTLK